MDYLPLILSSLQLASLITLTVFVMWRFRLVPIHPPQTGAWSGSTLGGAEVTMQPILQEAAPPAADLAERFTAALREQEAAEAARRASGRRACSHVTWAEALTMRVAGPRRDRLPPKALGTLERMVQADVAQRFGGQP